MSIQNIDGNLLKKMIISGANALDKSKSEVDALNVFPVPDGDTGTNMSLTFMAAAREAEKINSNNIYDVAKAVSSGSLRGARGNSGVILSQLFRGFAKGLEGCTTADCGDIANAFINASEMAYKAVMKPKEGTILTIANSMAEKAMDASFDTDDTEELMAEIVSHGLEVLAETQEMLPALKQAGVVDAGGKGLLIIWENALLSMSGDEEVKIIQSEASSGGNFDSLGTVATEDIKFAYCTEFFIQVDKANENIENELKAYYDKIGDSIIVVSDEDIIKVHMHSNNPGVVLERALRYGQLDNLKIDNMRIQHNNTISFNGKNGQAAKASDNSYEIKNGDNSAKITVNSKSTGDNPDEKKETGFIAVSTGEGFKELFLDLGADVVIEGGQTMNPSAEDFAEAIEKINSDNIIILPNNKNIFLAADQTKLLVKDKKVRVLPTKSVPQGVTALINYNDEQSCDENFEHMEEIIKDVNSGMITYAVRDTVIDGIEINKGDYLCMYNGDIKNVNKDLYEGAKELLSYMIDKGGEVLTIFYGENETEEDANKLLDYVEENFEDVEAEVYYGGQPIYSYIFSIE